MHGSLPFLLLLLLSWRVGAFNIDTRTPLVRYGQNGSYFGFSVASHIQADKTMILVGAPRAESGQPGTSQAGAVFKCPVHPINSGACEKLQVEYENDGDASQRPQKLGNRDLHTVGKDNQLLGFTVQSSGVPHGSAIVCAPLVRFSSAALTEGICYWLNNELKHYGTINTCQSLPKTDRHNEYAVCEQGFSAFIDKNMILTGAPGARKWTGGVHGRYYTTERGDGRVESIDDTIDRWTMNHEGVKETGIIRSLTSHDYLGYSVRYGKFGFREESENDDLFTVVSGAPRTNQTGSVIFLPFRTRDDVESKILGLYPSRFRINGTQVGSGFGFTLEVLDLNNDGFDDLLVSAPYEFHNDKDAERGGAVYVFFSTGEKQKNPKDPVFLDPIVLRGHTAHAQFGSSLAKLGSINLDEFADFAVGAPYDDEGKGAVYIFHGSRPEDFKTTPSQVIKPQFLTSGLRGPLFTFGTSLASNVDLDNNGYNDLVVGAFESDAAVILRARQIIDASLDYETSVKHVKINDECYRRGKACFRFTAKLKLMSKDGAASGTSFWCELTAVPFKKGVKPRAKVQQTDKHSYGWSCGKKMEESRDIEIYVPGTNEDWINPLKFNFTVSVKANERTNNRLLPIVNQEKSSRLFTVDFDKECGEDNKCMTDMVLEPILKNMIQNENGSYVSKVTQQDSIVIRFVVQNKREKAYASMLYVYYNHDELDEPTLNNTGTIMDKDIVAPGVIAIKLGNPVKDGARLMFDLSFGLVRSKSERVSASLNFTAFINGTSQETKPEDNRWEAEVKLIKEADVEIRGTSEPSELHFSGGNQDPEDEQDIGPAVIHRYSITNNGPFYAKNVSVFVDWPVELNDSRGRGKFVLYMLEDPIIRHNQKVTVCTVPPELKLVNVKGVHIEETTRLTYEGNKRNKRETAKLSSPSEVAQAHLLSRTNHNLKPTNMNVNGEDVDVLVVSCKDSSTICKQFMCSIEHLDAKDSVTIDIRARFWNNTFQGEYTGIDHVAINSSAHVVVDPKQGIVETQHNNYATILTQAYPDRPHQQKNLFWFIVLAVLLGLLLLSILVCICYKCGFFERDRRDRLMLHQAEYSYQKEMYADT